jgi:hypothetical protein
VAAPSSIAGPQAVQADRVLVWAVLADPVPAWVAPEALVVLLDAVPCIPRARRPAVLADRVSVRAWVRALVLVLVLGLASVPAWVARQDCRLPVKPRVRHVRVRVAAAVRATKRAKKAR